MPHRNQTIFDEGWQAWTDGARVNENPYSDYNNWSAWLDGWYAAEEDQQEQDKEADRGDWKFHQDHDQ